MRTQRPSSTISETVMPSVFNTLSATPLVPPPNPGNDPIIWTVRTCPQIAETRDEHAHKTRVYKLFDSTDKAINQLILGDVDEIFVRALYKCHIGYAKVTSFNFWSYIRNICTNHRGRPRNKWG